MGGKINGVDSVEAFLSCDRSDLGAQAEDSVSARKFFPYTASYS